MPRLQPLPRLLALCWATAALLSLAMIGAAVSLIDSTRDEALRDADNQIGQLVAAAESDVNRNLMSVDLILAGLPDSLRPALTAGGVDVELARRILGGLQERQLMFADLSLVDGSGHTLASAMAATQRPDIGVPAELLARALGPASRALQLSAPLIGKVSGERSLLLARAVDLPGRPPVVAIAEVPS